MDYSPERDIPKCVEQIKSLSPVKIVEWIRDNRTEKDALGKKHQTDLTPQSVSMWFKRHNDIYSALQRKLDDELTTPDAISEDVFQNGFFQEIPCVEGWQLKMRGRKAGEGAIGNFARILKQICKGEIPQTKKEKAEWKLAHPEQPVKPREYIAGWGMKHPARLTLEDCLRYNSEITKRGLKGRQHRLVMRNFLKSRNVEGYDTISGALEATAGQYAHLYIPKEKVLKCFAYLKAMNQEAHDASYFSYKTASRMNATLEAESKYFNPEEMTIDVFEKAALHQAKKRVTKIITPDLYEVIKPRLERGGKLFNITEGELNGILRACYQEVIPELANEIPMPFHFWRHQFAQHTLRASGWNYGLVAKLGNWTTQVLEKYYGAMDRNLVLTRGREIIPNL